MFAEQDHLAWRTHDPLCIARSSGVVRELLDCTVDTVLLLGRANIDVTVRHGRDCDGTSLKKGMLEIIDKVGRVFDTNA